ncbi:MAG TPA: sugar phosphate isomerase/epimerase [Hanamia sp.]
MFDIKFFCPRWGFENIPWSNFLKSVKEAGYSGIEWFPNPENDNYGEILLLLEKYDLDFCIVMAVAERFKNFESYIVSLKRGLLELAKIRNKSKIPLFISAQAGREFFNNDQILSCIDICKSIQEESRVPIYHETHRNKWTYAVHIVYDFIKHDKDLLLTLDISHWFCVSESYLQDQQYAVDEAISHARHIHARVGNTQSAQVWDPAYEIYEEALNEHLKVWDKWVRQIRNSQINYCTITPEFGPPPYLVPGDRTIPLIDEQWRLNLWIKEFLKKRYKDL